MKSHSKLDDALIPWHPAFVEAIQLVLGPYRDVLQFLPEHQLGSEPLRVDVIIIKKLKNVMIDTAIAASFGPVNVVEYKSPTDHIAVADFYKVYAYACLYAASPEETVPITDLTITFVGSRYPRKLVSHLKKVRGYTVEERAPGIYSVKGDIIPIQVIDSRKLTGGENVWLKNLDNKLDAEGINEIVGEIGRLGKAAQVGAYVDVISRANVERLEEAYQMSRKKVTLEQVLEDIGLTAKWEARGEVRGEARNKVEVAKNLITRIGLPLDQVAEATGLDLETVQSLAHSAG
jgi:hypothetical protein